MTKKNALFYKKILPVQKKAVLLHAFSLKRDLFKAKWSINLATDS